MTFSSKEKMNLLRQVGYQIQKIKHQFQSPGYQNSFDDDERDRYIVTHPIKNTDFNWHNHLFNPMDQVDSIFDSELKYRISKLFK